MRKNKAQKDQKEIFANALALTFGILWVLDSAFVVLFPRLSTVLTRIWFHGLKVGRLGKFNVTFSDFLIGGVTLILVGWIIGYIFGWSLEYIKENLDK